MILISGRHKKRLKNCMYPSASTDLDKCSCPLLAHIYLQGVGLALTIAEHLEKVCQNTDHRKPLKINH